MGLLLQFIDLTTLFQLRHLYGVNRKNDYDCCEDTSLRTKYHKNPQNNKSSSSETSPYTEWRKSHLTPCSTCCFQFQVTSAAAVTFSKNVQDFAFIADTNVSKTQTTCNYLPKYSPYQIHRAQTSSTKFNWNPFRL